MGNYRTKLSRSGCDEVAVNSGKRSRSNPERESPHCNIKRARRAEVNYLPNFPRGEDALSLERLRVHIADEASKADRNLQMIAKLMQTAYALRRKQIIVDNPSQPVKDFLQNWPALRLESQICAEFHRITNVNLQNKFYAELDKHTPRLLAVFRQKAARTGKTAEAVRSIFTAYDVLTEQEDEPDIKDLALALLSVVNEEPSSLVHFSPIRIGIVLEGDMVMNELTNLADALLMMFGLMYALNLDYPKELTHTFNFIQKVLMGLDDFKPRLLNLKMICW
ncbi:hypothetical protein MHYP_G00360350 [Metynnis hypsauchen]